MYFCAYFFVVVQLLSHVQLFATPWTIAHQAPLSFTISQSSLRFISSESVMPSNRLILCCPLLLLPSVFPSSFFIYRQHISYLMLWNKISQMFMPWVFYLWKILWGSRWRAEKFSRSCQGFLVGLWSPGDHVVAPLGPHDLRQHHHHADCPLGYESWHLVGCSNLDATFRVMGVLLAGSVTW